MSRQVTGLSVCAVAACMLWFASVPYKASAQTPTAYDLAGKLVNPLKMAAGKPAVLIFVRTDCPVSNRYAPTIKGLSQSYAGKVRFFLVYPDKSETAANIEKHVQDYSLQMATLRDPQHALVRVGQVEITPEIAVFDGTGKLIYHGRIDNWYQEFGRARPAPTTHEMNDAILAALSGGPAPASVGGVGCYISDLK